jgi:ParB family chromosome partitioning protein
MAAHRPSSQKRPDPKPSRAAPQRKALGRGLAALMPTQTREKPAVVAKSDGYRLLPIERVVPNKTQPRKHFDEAALAELAASITVQGVLQPIIVRRGPDGYEIVAGERRWRAASRAGIKEIPAVIKELSDEHALQIALIENVQREDLDPLEEAESYSRLIRDHKLTHDQIAVAVGKNRSTITNSIRLLKLPEQVLAILADGRLSAGHARALMTLSDPKQICAVAEDLVGRHASVRDAEVKVRSLLDAKRPRGKNRPDADATSTATASVQERLQQALNTKVKLIHKAGKGRIEIHFHSLDSLDALLDKIIT